MNNSNYAAYYHRTMQHHATGVKSVVGGTGLGKTHGARLIVTDPQYADRKFMYMANRKQLLVEMAEKLDSALYVMVPRDLEAVQDTLQRHRSALYRMLGDHTFRVFAESYSRYNGSWRIDLGATRQACKDLEEFSSRDPYVQKRLEDVMESQARRVLDTFRAAVLAARGTRGKNAAYERLLDDPVIQSLFPGIAFRRRPEARIMLITLHKAFYGFFDGEKTQNLTRLQGENNIPYTIFLDEFDFLEHDLVDLICRSREISDPFLFTELFYRRMVYHKLPHEPYLLTQQPIRDRINKIIELIEPLRHHLGFPDLNQFTSTLPRDADMRRSTTKGPRQTPAIFRTQHTISTNPLYLYRTPRSFDLVASPDPERGTPYSALRFFGTVSRACQLALNLFKELEREDPIIHREIVRQCFRETDFPEQMARLSNYARLNETPLTTRASFLEGGYSLYDIKDLQQVTDREEVEVRHYGMYLTPEAILYMLAKQHLVFGLSATVDIARQVHNFDLDWLREKRILLEVDEEERAIVHTLNQEKAKIRANQVHLKVVQSLDLSDPYQAQLDQLVQAVSTDEDFAEVTASEPIKERVRLFFSALLTIQAQLKQQQPTAPAHALLFFNTFRQMKFIFDRYPGPDHQLFTVKKRDDHRWFEVYDLQMQNEHSIIVFYNAELAKAVRHSEAAQSAFDRLFWEGRSVILVTQYLSAGNGINLQYLPTPESTDEDRRDFTVIGLLERPYYYFSKPSDDATADEQAAAQKKNIWYLAKLYFSKALSEHDFRYLLSILNYPDTWNTRYRTHEDTRTDALLNDMSTFIQALGRVERIWKEMPDQTVLLSPEVDRCFQAFCSPAFDERRLARVPIQSENLRQLFEQVQARSVHLDRQIRRQKDERLRPQNALCQQSVGVLLQRLVQVRQGNEDHEACRHWEQLRKAVLRHDFKDTLLQRYACVMESPHYQKGRLHLDANNDIVPADLLRHDGYRWNMNALYERIRLNPVIADYFRGEGYELAFDHINKAFFVPYCFQAILTGAIGEEAIRALLLEEGFTFEPVPERLFEVADLKMAGVPYYIDCKYFSDWTMQRFSLSPEDPAYHGKLNDAHFKVHARKKLDTISTYHGEPGKLLYINLVSHFSRPLDYYTEDFTPVEDFTDASIVVVQGALQEDTIALPQVAFQRLCQDMKRALLAQEKGSLDANANH